MKKVSYLFGTMRVYQIKQHFSIHEKLELLELFVLFLCTFHKTPSKACALRVFCVFTLIKNSSFIIRYFTFLI